MTAVKRASGHNSRLIAPRLHDVIELTDRAARAPEQMQRRFNAFVRISFVVGKINRCGGTVVLADGVNCFRITVAAQIFLENIFFKGPLNLELAFDMVPQEVFRINVEELFRERLWLNQEEPPEIARGKLLVSAFIHRSRRRNVDEDGLAHQLGPIKRETMPYASPSVMSYEVTLFNSERLQQQLQIARHFSLAVETMIGRTFRLRGITVTAQIHQDDLAILCHRRGYFTPDHMRMRVPMHHQ